MMGRLKSDQGQLFYEFDLGDAVPEDHLVRKIDSALDLSWLRSDLAPHYSSMGRPSIDPELMIRMLVVGYVFAVRSERLICREVQVNLAYRWFCKLGIEDAIPDHSAFSRVRNERFREGDVFRRMFERVVETCIAAGLVGGEGFAVDASLIAASAMTSCTSGWSVEYCVRIFSFGGRPSTKRGLGGLSRNSPSLIRCQITSTRKPSTPLRSQKRMTSWIACRTSGFRQFRSGCWARKA